MGLCIICTEPGFIINRKQIRISWVPFCRSNLIFHMIRYTAKIHTMNIAVILILFSSANTYIKGVGKKKKAKTLSLSFRNTKIRTKLNLVEWQHKRKISFILINELNSQNFLLREEKLKCCHHCLNNGCSHDGEIMHSSIHIRKGRLASGCEFFSTQLGLSSSIHRASFRKFVVTWTRVYLKIWLRLFFKVFFINKYIKIIFFLFLKIIFASYQNDLKISKKLI